MHEVLPRRFRKSGLLAHVALMRTFNHQGERTYMGPGDKEMVMVEKSDRGDGIAFVDWLTVSFPSAAIQPRNGWPMVPGNDDDVITLLVEKLETILGFGIFEKREKGHLFYKSSWSLGEGGRFGYLAIGGQRDTVLIDLNGTGCMHAMLGWEARMVEFLESGMLLLPRITRIDLAHDDIKGSYTPDAALEDWRNGSYQLPKAPLPPSMSTVGNWEFDDGRGRTLYIGRRASGKFLRVYEKGKQLGDPESPWTRVELEMKAEDRVIPFDALRNPGIYLAGAYPALARLCTRQSRIETVRHAAKSGLNGLLAYLGKYVAPSLVVACSVLGTDQAMDQITEHVTDKHVARVLLNRSMDMPLHQTEFAAGRAGPGSGMTGAKENENGIG
jgi:phage replication initiation protein